MPFASRLWKRYVPTVNSLPAILVTDENVDEVAKLLGGEVVRAESSDDADELHLPTLDGPLVVNWPVYVFQNKVTGVLETRIPSVFEESWRLPLRGDSLLSQRTFPTVSAIEVDPENVSVEPLTVSYEKEK